MKDFLSDNASQVLFPHNQCTAIAKSTGERCERHCDDGFLVCHFHGAGSPKAKQGGRERLDSLVHPAMAVIHRALRSGPPCEVCGRSDSDRDPVALRAATAVLDRTGFGAQTKVEISAPVNTFAEMDDDELEAHLEMMQDKISSQLHLLRGARGRKQNWIEPGDVLEADGTMSLALPEGDEPPEDA